MKTTLYSKKTLLACIFFFTSLFSLLAAPLLPGSLVADKTICYNANTGSLSASMPTGGCVGTRTYQWSSSTDGVSYTNIGGATAYTYTVNLTTTTYFKRTVTDVCLSTAETEPVKITVSSPAAPFLPGTIGTTSTIITGSSTLLTNTASASGGYSGSTYTYQWYANESGSYVSISGATNDTYTTPALTSTVYYRRTATSNSPCGSYTATSNIVTITVAAVLLPGTLIADKSICYNTGTGSLSVSQGSGGCAGTKSYQWLSSTDGVSYTNIAGATTSSYSATLTVTTYFKRVITDACSNTAETTPVQITVGAAATTFAAGTIGTTSTICSGSSIALTNSVSASGGYSGAAITYQWYTNASGSYVSISGATDATYTTPTLTSSVSYRRFATSTASCGSFVGNSNTVTITTVTSLPAAASITGTLVQCPGNTGIVYTTSGVAGATSYIWTLPAGVTAVSGQTTSAITVDFNANYAGGTISSAGVNACGTGATVSATLTVGTCDWIWTGAAGTNWTTAGNWSTGSVPTSTSNVIIPNVSNKPILNTTNARVNNIDINTGSSLTITGATSFLLVYGNLTNSGTLTTVGTAKIQTTKVSGSQTFSGDLTGIKYLVKSGNATLNLGNDWVVSGRIDLKQGTIDVNGHALTFDVANGGYVGYTTGDVGTITGNVNVFKALGQYTHNIATPLTGITAAQINDDFPVLNPANGRSRLFNWNPATQNWATPGLPVSTSLNRGTGYNFYCTTAGTLDFTGSYTQSTTPIVLSGTTSAAGGLLLLGNPYLADLNWENISKSNVDATVYYWNQSAQAYASYTTGGSSSNGGTIRVPVLQGFFVSSVSAGSASISIDPTAIYNSAPTSTFYRISAPSDKFNFVVKDNTGKSDEAVIVINEDATSDFDGALDAYKLENPGTSLNLYTTLGATDYAVNTIPSSATNQIVSLSFAAPVSGIYTIESTDVSLSTTNVYLKDKVTGTITSIDALPYTFTAESTDAPERFDVLFRTSTTTSTQSAAATAGISFASFQKDLVILNQSLQMSNATIVITDLTGNAVKTITGASISNNATFNLSELTSGMYMIKLIDQSNGNAYSGKVSIQ